jgi:N-acetylglucosaminyldiphosphoundecaprenol N-acetyl-beta-D-mannosaminyltransferase
MPSKNDLNEINFLGLRLHNLTMDETLQQIGSIIRSSQPKQHVVLNAAKVVHSQKDKELRQVINNCDLINADGQAIVWAARFLGFPFKERVAGIDLMNCLLAEAGNKNWKVYFFGARQDVLDSMLEVVRHKFNPALIAGARHGYFKDEEAQEIALQIAASKADILFVGISSPQKEHFLNKYLQVMKVPFVMGVGGSFDILAGRTKRAPLWMQKMGLEWVYRIYQEPRRMWKRYATTNPVFIYLIFKQKLSIWFGK